MIKIIIVFISIFISFTHGMQKIPSPTIENTKNSLTLLADSLLFPSNTKIILIQQSLFEVNKRQGIIVVGKSQQKIASPGLETFDIVGEVHSFLDKILYKKNDDSTSDDETYKPYPYRPGHQRKPIKIEQQLACNVLVITEPRITRHFDKDKGKSSFMYDAIRKNECLTFIDNEAITQASKDLAFCYKEALNKGLSTLRYNTKERTISFPTLSADVGFPRDKAAHIAIETVFEFIKNYPNIYQTIYFYVKKRSDITLYRRLLLQKTKLFHNISLFFWEHKNEGSVLSWLPMELIDYIVKLILMISY